MKQVFIVGAYGQNNLGDEALLEVFMKQFEGWQLVVNSAQPAVTAQRYGVKTVGTYFNWPPRFARPRAVLQSDLIVFGGGSLLKEIEGGAVARLLYFARILLILIVARLTRKQTAMLGVGMGPLNYPLYKALTRWCARLTDVICVRDRESRDLLVAIGVKRDVQVTADAVFTLEIQPDAEKLDLPFAEDSPYVVVVPRYSLNDAECLAMAQACDMLVDQHHLRILLLPFQADYRDHFDDAAAARRIRTVMKHPQEAYVWQTEKPSAAFAAIGKAQLVLSARLHALIFASMQAVPPIAISYEVKVASFMAGLGQSPYTLSLTDLQSGRLIAALERAISDSQAIREQVRERSTELRANSQRNFDFLKSRSPGAVPTSAAKPDSSSA